MHGRYLLAIGYWPLILVGCATVEERMDDYAHLSCSQLDQKIGETRYARREAEHDSIVSDVVTAVGNKKQREDAAIDGLAADLGKDAAKVDLHALRALKDEKGCPR